MKLVRIEPINISPIDIYITDVFISVPILKTQIMKCLLPNAQSFSYLYMQSEAAETQQLAITSKLTRLPHPPDM